ncbi:9388_t:CDS:2 [Gigaspora rosea]|nr:9388_t:CDS:2 [Gigaspora rosea]
MMQNWTRKVAKFQQTTSKLKELIKIKLTKVNEASNRDDSYQSEVGAGLDKIEEEIGVEKNKNKGNSRKRRKEKIVPE